MPLRLKVGLTGGIAAGKSTVLAQFARLGVPALDADNVAREVVAAGTPGLAELVERVGGEILATDGTLDRGALRRRIFADAALRKTVEGVIHPRVRRAMTAWARATDAPYGVLCIPLLFESGMRDVVDRVLVVDAPEALQVRRVMARDNCGEDAARAILASQLERRQRLAGADDVITNDGAPEELARAVDRLHRRYLHLARGHLPARHE